MKLSSLRYVKKTVLTFLLTAFLLITVLETILPAYRISVSASPGTTVAIDPSLISANPGYYFTINITVTNVTDLYSWGWRVKWPYGRLETEAANITEGPFLKQGGNTGFTRSVSSNEIDIGCGLLGAPSGVSGNGTLASATFKVLTTGSATLDLYRVSLLNSTLGAIDDWQNKDSPDDGLLYNTLPTAKYTYTPHPTSYPGHPIVNETVTFNATESYDPDDPYEPSPGGIVSYKWDFGDGNTTTVSDPIIIHTYTKNDSYTVTLNVTDDDGESYSVDHPIVGTTILVQHHDIAVINVTATPAEVSLGGEFTINITVWNQGSSIETLNVTVYANMYPIETKLFEYWKVDAWGGLTSESDLEPGKNKTATVIWDTTGVPVGNYTISVKAFLVKLIEGKWQAFPDLEREKDMFDNGMLYGDIAIIGNVAHDLAITDLEVSPTNLKIDEWAYIDVAIKNEGTVTEQFNATITIESESGTTVVKPGDWSNQSIYAGTTVTLEYLWLKGTNTTKEGEYNITANVVLVNTTLGLLQPYNASNPDDDPTENTRKISQTILLLPVAHFTYSPSELLVDKTITFNASASYAPGVPGGTIEQYTWDFGDDTGVTETDPITSHVFRLNKTYTITLTVTDNDARARSFSRNIKVDPFQNIAITNMTFSPHIATSGDPISIDVTVNARFFEESFNVTTYFNGNTIVTRSNTTLPVGDSTTLTFTWDTTGVTGGNYTLKAVVTTTTENITYISGIVTIKLLPSSITLSIFPASFTVGATTTLNGSVSVAQSELGVTIWYRLVSEETWSILADVRTDANGIYSYSWAPETTGTYAVKASWQGDESTMPSESEVGIVMVQELLQLGLFLYTTVGLTITLVALLFYFLKIRKP